MPRAKAPPLPKTLWSPLGPVVVRVVSKLPNDEAAAAGVFANDFGSYDPAKREIYVLRRLHPWARHQAMWHEWFHMLIFDAGYQNGLSPEMIEGLCDVTATALAAELRARHLDNALTTPPKPAYLDSGDTPTEETPKT